MCAKAVAEHDGHLFPVSNFDPLHPTARDLPAVGMYISRCGDASASVARLDALAVPAEHHADREKLRALIDQVAANAQRQIAAERSNVTRFEQTVTIARSLAKQIDLLGATPTASRQTHTAAHIGSRVRPVAVTRSRGATAQTDLRRWLESAAGSVRVIDSGEPSRLVSRSGCRRAHWAR
jgi:hypothetical protein